MHLTHLRLVNFRNHPRTEIALGPGLNVFVGPNAQGKSSLLEAVEVMASGRSHRVTRDIEILRFGESWARVHAAGRRRDREVEVDVSWRLEGAPASTRTAEEAITKEMRVNGVPVRRGELFGHVLAVVASSLDEQVVSGPPALRRRLLDLSLAQVSPAYYFMLLRYTRAVAQRNRLLRDLYRVPAASRDRTLEPWDAQVAVMGAALTARRRDMVERLATAARQAYEDLSGGLEVLTVAYAPSVVGTEEATMIASAREALIRRRQEELLRGTTLTGPHRDDLRMQIDGRDLRTFGSRGQQQTVMVALRLAERRALFEDTGEEPVMLLDDTLQSLDEERQERLLARLDRAQALVCITTLATLRHLPAATAVFRVTGGAVEVERAHTA